MQGLLSLHVGYLYMLTIIFCPVVGQRRIFANCRPLSLISCCKSPLFQGAGGQGPPSCLYCIAFMSKYHLQQAGWCQKLLAFGRHALGPVCVTNMTGTLCRHRAGFKSVRGPQYAVPLVGCVIAMVKNPYQFWEDQRKYVSENRNLLAKTCIWLVLHCNSKTYLPCVDSLCACHDFCH